MHQHKKWTSLTSCSHTMDQSKSVKTRTANHSTMLCLIALLLMGSAIRCQTLSGDALLPNQELNDTTTLVSAKGTFVLGFFSPLNKTTRYLGIWYQDMKPLTIVWVANREVPIPSKDGNSRGTLTLTTQGMLTINDGTTSIWSTGTVITDASKAQLLDTGNFVVTDDTTGNLLWQSFDSPCDTMLPGMVIGFDSQAQISRYLTAWKSSSDPALGDYLVRMDPKRLPDLLLYNGNNVIYRTGIWNGRHYDGIPEMKQTNQLVFNLSWTQTSVYYSFVPNINVNVLWRLVIHNDGEVRRWYSLGNSWVEYWHLPQDTCDGYAHCGINGLCVNGNSDCNCLPGYSPKAPASWNLRNFSDGCVRSELFNCTKGDDFMTVQNVKLPDTFSTTTFFGMNFEECRRSCLGVCSCVAFAYIDNKCVIWNNPLVDIVQFDSGDELYLRINATEKPKHISLVGIISTIVGGVLFLLMIIFVSICCLHRRSTNEIVEKLRSSSIDHSPRPQESNLFIDTEVFDIKTLRAATNNFYDKLGEGCFGPVYKATLEDGRIIAAKRLSKEACKGLRQFVNEVNLLRNLSHRNLVQLLGYCVDDQERILCYEYMPNGSLDKFLDNPLRTNKHDSQLLHSQFGWQTRSRIIEEISFGVLYLHDECGKKIVHRDLKPGNILLDENMIPKISDFGFAKLCRKDQRSTYTEIFAGTKGYMAPEMVSGKISTKVDVFSFGIIIMEIVTGRSASSFPTGIINHVATYWMEYKELELIDPRMKDNVNKEEIVRFIMISFLCVQQDQDKRPEMRNINVMLNSMTTLLYVPRDLFIDWGISFELPPSVLSSSTDMPLITTGSPPQ